MLYLVEEWDFGSRKAMRQAKSTSVEGLVLGITIYCGSMCSGRVCVLFCGIQRIDSDIVVCQYAGFDENHCMPNMLTAIDNDQLITSENVHGL